MCQFVAYYHVACQHTDIQPVQMCGAVRIDLARINEQTTSAGSAVPFSPRRSCVPCFPEVIVQSNIVAFYIIQPDQISPMAASKNNRLQLLRQRARIAVYGQAGPQGQIGVHGQAEPYEQAHHQTLSWVSPQQQTQHQPQLRFQMAPPPQPFANTRPPSPPIAGLCLSCTQSVESVERIQQTQPNYGLTEEEVMGPETLRFVVESYQKAHELVNNWIECMSAFNPFNTRYAAVDYPGFPFLLSRPPYSGLPDISMEPMVEELTQEIMMRKANAMIIQYNDEIRAIENRFAEEGTAYFENNPDRFVSHSPAEDPFQDDEPLGDVPEVVHPLLHNQPRPRHEILVKPKQRVSRAVRDYIGIRETHNQKSPTPNPRYMHGTSVLEAHMAASMEIDEGSDTDGFTFTDRADDTDTEVSTDIDDDADADTVVYPASIKGSSPMVMSDTPALTIDNTPSGTSVTSISTPSTAPRSRKRVRIVESERWRGSLRPRLVRDESMNGLYID